MEKITVHTTQNIDIDYEVGGLGERILAYLIDLGIFIALSIIGGILSASAFSGVVGEVYFIILGIALLFYDLVCETFLNGQSVGKKVMKIKVISADGTRPKFSQYLLRWLFRIVDNFGITSYLGGVISIIVTDKGQRIGDLVAGTIIIRTEPRTTMNSIIYKNTDAAYVPVFTQVSQLKEEDVALIHEVMENYYQTGNHDAIYKIADRIREYLGINLPANMNSMQFLQTIIKDYGHITAQADIL